MTIRQAGCVHDSSISACAMESICDRCAHGRRLLIPTNTPLHFSGNLDTLVNNPRRRNVDVFKKVKGFHNSYYCGRNMALVSHRPMNVLSVTNVTPHRFSLAPDLWKSRRK
eukprot:GHVU01052699.1.p1 GENE.GHVU01052699.1~~GHVU01052699.1.p1  ORF type:complete len:111 (-),score=3.16 GHVU01052699.1:63-395(-)